MRVAAFGGIWLQRCGPRRGEGTKVSKQTNVVSFPLTVRDVRSAAKKACSPTSYEFTEGELAALCRWFSAMKYAFPGTEGVMMVNHQESYSAVGLYNRAGGAPNCLVAKHEVSGAAQFFWSTEFDPPRPIKDLSEITNASATPTRSSISSMRATPNAWWMRAGCCVTPLAWLGKARVSAWRA